MTVPAVGYVRVSTDRQAEEGYGLPAQRQAIAGYCKRAGLRLVTVEADEGVSGTLPAAQRPGLARALASVPQVGSELVVARLDRLARTLTVQEGALAEVWRLGGHVHAADTGRVEPDDPADPMRTFVRQVMGAAAQLERAALLARMTEGRRVKAAAGGYAGGRPRFGWQAVGRELVPHPGEREVVLRIVQLRRAGLSLARIAEQLNAEGRRCREATGWKATAVRRVLLGVGMQTSTSWEDRMGQTRRVLAVTTPGSDRADTVRNEQ